MIKPSEITNYYRNEYELEEFLLFCVCAAGKNSNVQAGKLDQVIVNVLPFATIRCLNRRGTLVDALKRAKLGKYDLLSKSFTELSTAKLDLEKVHWRQLITFPGIGIKTAKFFLCHSRIDFVGAVLDTHILKFLAREHPKANIPKVSPSQIHRYQEIESLFLAECFKRKTPPAALDLQIWNNKGFID
jgi:thermostable 8-oxoguanine DNA glycosylase